MVGDLKGVEWLWWKLTGPIKLIRGYNDGKGGRKELERERACQGRIDLMVDI